MPEGTAVTDQAARPGSGGGQALVPGWNVPGYTGLKTLGSGAFGQVVLARQDESGTLVAIKYLRPSLLDDERFATMFRGEAAVLAALDDPHVVRLYAYVESPWGAAIVMELVDGISLRQILAEQGGTTPEAALVVLQGSLLGLAAAHARGVVHRDYKPDNVLVDADGVSKLTDFGIAARTGDRTAQGGTLAYAPPEQFSDAPSSPAGDVYAATATFFECLTGQPPFRGESAAALLYQHVSKPVPVDQVPAAVRPLVAAGMAKQPEDRPADASLFVAALNRIATEAYGPDWYERGRSHLAGAALLLAALWPTAASAIQGAAAHAAQGAAAHAAQGAAVQHAPLRQPGTRRPRTVKTAIAAGAAVVVAGAGTYAAIGLTHHAAPVTLPAITGVSPAVGSTVGGSTVTISGTGLGGATVVRFGGTASTITADSATRITVTSPPRAGTAGVVDILVTTPAGTSHQTAADHFTYTTPGPAITGVSPGIGGTKGGTPVTLAGTGLAGATSVRFGNSAARITADSTTQITVISPPGTGRVPIVVTTPAGTSEADKTFFTYTSQPKPTQSIIFSAPASASPGGSGTLSAIGGGSGNPVVFSVDPASGPGVCTVSGNTVTYGTTGNCVVDANQAGNAHYDAAPQVQRTIRVGALPQSISFAAPATGTVGGSGTLTATGGGSGNPVVFSADGSGVCAVSGNTVTYIAGGTCVVDANQAGNTQYVAAPTVERTIMVTKLSQSITFTAPQSGTTVSSAGLSASGGGSGNPVVFSVDPSTNSSVCHVSGNSVTFTGAGSCVIDANQAGNTQYAAAPQVQRTITVTKTPVTPTSSSPPPR